MGKGTVYLTIASIVFFLCGYIMHIGLGRYLGPEDYGIFGVILSLMSTINIVLTSGFPDAASKYIAEDDTKLSSIVRHSRKIQALFSIALFALYFGLAGVIANLLHDPKLTYYIRISAFVIPVYAFYYVYYSYLNGLRLFGKQAKTLAAVAVMRVGLIFALVIFGLSVKGAIIGYILSAFIGLLLAWKYLGKIRESSADLEWSKLIKYGIPVTLFSVMLFLLMSIDLLAVKSLIQEGVDFEKYTGYYTSAATIAKGPYFAFAGVTIALFPSISFSTSRGDSQLTNSYIKQSMRYMLMILIPGILLISATSSDLISLVYSSEYVEAANSLSVLVFGLGFLTVFAVLTTIIMGGGKPYVALGIALPIVAIDIALNIILIPKYELMGAAWATTITALIGMILAAIYVFKHFQALVSTWSAIKICLAALIIYVIALQISLSPSFLPLIYAGLITLYFILLLLMKEFSKEDVETFKRIIPMAKFRGTRE